MTLINITVGLLGHVDSGKTALAKALTTIPSTACLDKHKQSQDRGITIDLGFSSFTVPANDDFNSIGYSEVQITLVDCPGHASLIRKIIGGSQIVDFILLVVDITKGIQTQTAECLVIAEILNKDMLIVLNKIDLVPKEKRDATITKVIRKLQTSLKDTIFKTAPMVAISANAKTSSGDGYPEGIERLIDAMKDIIKPRPRVVNKPLVLSVDHCFSIKGKGTILTGTIIQGRLNTNDTIEIPHLKTTKKVKSIQMFKKDIVTASAGDRVGVCVTQFDAKLMEQGTVCSVGYLRNTHAVITNVNHVKYFKSKIKSNSKYHVSIGHYNVIGKITLFKMVDGGGEFVIEDKSYEYLDELPEIDECTFRTFVLLEFEHPVPCGEDDCVIVSKLDIDINKQCCRIAFHGRVHMRIVDPNYSETILPKLLIYKWKEKRGLVYKIVNDREIIAHSIFKKETKMHPFINLKVVLTTGETGFIKSTFGQGGKVKVELNEDIKTETKNRFVTKDNQCQVPNSVEPQTEKIQVILRFKRYIYDKNKTVIQS